LQSSPRAKPRCHSCSVRLGLVITQCQGDDIRIAVFDQGWASLKLACVGAGTAEAGGMLGTI